MRYHKQRVMMATRHNFTHQEFTSDTVEGLVAIGTGLAIAPINENKTPGATFANCSQWVLMLLECGRYIGEPFPADTAFAKAYLEEVSTIDLIQIPWAEIEGHLSIRKQRKEQIEQARQRVERRFVERGSRVVQEALF